MKAPLVKTFRKSFPQKVTLVLRRKLRRNQERPRIKQQRQREDTMKTWSRNPSPVH